MLQTVSSRDRATEIVIEQVDKEALNAPYPDVEYRMNGQLIEASEEEKHNLNMQGHYQGDSMSLLEIKIMRCTTSEV